MHRQDSAAAVLEHDDLVLERLPNGEHAWLKPEQPEQPERDDDHVDNSGRWDGTWPTFEFRVMTTFRLVAPTLETAAAWFTSYADVELVDCDAMIFGVPELVEVITGGADS